MSENSVQTIFLFGDKLTHEQHQCDHEWHTQDEVYYFCHICKGEGAEAIAMSAWPNMVVAPNRS